MPSGPASARVSDPVPARPTSTSAGRPPCSVPATPFSWPGTPGSRTAATGSERRGRELAYRTLRLVEPDPLQGHTRVSWDDPLTDAEARGGLPAAWAFRQRASLFGHNAPDYRAMAEEVKKAYQEERREPIPGREERPPSVNFLHSWKLILSQ